MIAEAINRILELSEPHTIQTAYRTYSDKKLYTVEDEQRAEPLEVSSLTGLVEYIRDFKEDRKKDLGYIVHVVSPTCVRLESALDNDRARETLMLAKAELPRIPFEQYIDNQTMLIAVLSMFVDDDATDRAAVLKFAGTVTKGSVKEYDDDGVTQKATIKQGVASKVEAIVPSPCVLRPYRTFLEVQQPASRFIFRMREGLRDDIESALFPADGGAWRMEARNSIRDYLKKELDGLDVTVIA